MQAPNQPSAHNEGRSAWLGLHAVTVWAILICFGPSAFPQSVLFSDDAERALMGGDKMVMNWTVAGTMAASTAQVHSGRYSYAATTTGSDSNAYRCISPAIAATVTCPTPPADPLYLKTWIYIPSTFTASTTKRIIGLSQIPGSYATYAVNITASGGSLYLNAGGQTGGHAITRDAWHSVEFKYYRNTGSADGAVQVWLDGTSEISLGNMTLETKNTVLIGIGGGDGTIYIDDISVSQTPSNNPSAGITVRHADPHARIKMRIQSYLWGTVSTDSLISSIDGTPFSTITDPGTFQDPVLDVSQLPAGNHTLTVALKDAGGTPKATWTETLYFAGGIPLIGIDENNNLVKGGHKIFPVTPWFMGPSNTLSWLTAGYINAAGWAGEWSPNYSTTQYNTYMHTSLNCDSNGLLVAGPFHARAGDGILANDVANYTAYASTFQDDTCVLAWTAYDEAQVNDIRGGDASASDHMMKTYAAVKASDKNHPLWYDDASFPWLNLTWYHPRLVADVYSSDNYPLCYQNTYKSNGKTFADWIRMMNRDSQANYGLVPDLVVLELYKFVYAPSQFDCRPVTAASVFNQAWLSVIHGRKGVTWYDNGAATTGYAPVCADDNATSCFPAQPERHIGRFVSQIARITPDVILGTAPQKLVTSDRTAAGSRVDIAVRESGSTLWIFAARVTDIIRDPAEATASPLTTAFAIAGLGSANVEVFDEGRTLQINGGMFTDTFDPYEVHIYRIPISKSPAPPTAMRATVN